jgi:hypothetical protein
MSHTMKYEPSLKGERKPRVNYCGDCGEECDSLLCDDCAVSVTSRWEPVMEMERRTR